MVNNYMEDIQGNIKKAKPNHNERLYTFQNGWGLKIMTLPNEGKDAEK